MKINQIATEILKQSVRTVSKKKFKDQSDFLDKVNSFISSINSNLVKLTLVNTDFKLDDTDLPYQHWKVDFNVIFTLDDPYVDSKIYESGSVYIFPSKNFYEDVDKVSEKLFDAIPVWDSTKIRATITGEARAY